MYQDIVTTARLVEVPYSEEVIKRTLNTFGGFSRSAVQFRTTTKPMSHRRLDVRYEEIGSPEMPLEVARKAGYFRDEGRDIDKLLPQLYEHFPYLGDGMDFDVLDGITKFWFFPKGPFPVEKAFELSAMPRSVAEHAWYYEKYNLSAVYIIAVDFFSRTMNLYFPFMHPSHHTQEALRGMVEDLGFEAPPEEAITYSLPGISAALTYSWDSPRLNRICFYVGFPNRATTPKGMHPVIDRFIHEVPAYKDSVYQISWTFGAKGAYIKVENDYTGNMMEKFVKALMGDSLADEFKS
jgi:hypothetical protein